MEYILTEQQREIIESNDDKILVIASAGTSKTTVMVERIKYLVGGGADPSKIVAITFTRNAAQEIISRLGDISIFFCGTIHAFANYLLLCGGHDTSGYIKEEDFDGLFNELMKYPECLKKDISNLFLDEAQDSNSAQFEFIFDLLRPQRWVLMADPKQCQPTGTKIRCANNVIKNIEDIQVGDELMYYDEENYTIHTARGSTNTGGTIVEKISSRIINNNEPIIHIITENGKESNYTPNHITFGRFNKVSGKYALYLMCNHDYRFRIGTIPLNYHTRNSSVGNPWRTKLKDEKCEKIWILQVYDTNHEALLNESKYSYKYQIPQTCWQTDKVSWTLDDIEYIYDGLNTRESAEQCLKEFNRDIRYPLLDFSIPWSANAHFAYNACAPFYAINYMPEIMDCLAYVDSYSEKKTHKQFETVTNVEYFYPEESNYTVYSLQTDKHTYIADDIITHNCIYEFNGSEPWLINELADEPGVQTYMMTENFRNGRSIHAFAKTALEYSKANMHDISKPMREAKGKVVKLEYDLDYLCDIIKETDEPRDWFVLAFTNAEVENMVNLLTRKGIPCCTFKQSELKNSELKEKMAENTVKVLTCHSSKGLENKNVAVLKFVQTDAEKDRLFYVACTRAKDLLVVVARKPARKKKNYRSWE